MKARTVLIFTPAKLVIFEEVESFGPEHTDKGPIFWVEGVKVTGEGRSAKGYFEFHRDDIRSISITV